jgi:hypothetical protein
MGTETKPISAETPGPIENDMNLFRKSRGDSRKQIPPRGYSGVACTIRASGNSAFG